MPRLGSRVCSPKAATPAVGSLPRASFKCSLLLLLLCRELMFDGVHVDSIHADQSQAARQAAVDNFRCAQLSYLCVMVSAWGSRYHSML